MKKKLNLFIIILIFSANSLFSSGNKDTNTANTIEENDPTLITEPELVMKALYEAFDDKIDKVEFRKDDWAVLMKSVWYYYAKGKLLPEKELKRAAKYRPYQFYKYPAELPPQTEATPEEIEMYLSWTNQTSKTLSRSVSFLGVLWEASTRKETEKQIVDINFLGQSARVHKGIQQKLAVIEEQIQAAAKTDNAIQTWIDALAPPGGYYWRVIAKTKSCDSNMDRRSCSARRILLACYSKNQIAIISLLRTCYRFASKFVRRQRIILAVGFSEERRLVECSVQRAIPSAYDSNKNF